MLGMHEYVNEKLRELERERTGRQLLLTSDVKEKRSRGRKPVFGPMIRAAGGALRRAGEGLESWAAPRAAREAPRWRFDEPPS